MSDLIRRKDAVELLKNDMEHNGLPLYDDYNIGINHAMCLLACVPTADLVRCADCKYWTDDMSGNMWCEHAIGGLTEPTDFCSFGERRAEDERQRL